GLLSALDMRFAKIMPKEPTKKSPGRPKAVLKAAAPAPKPKRYVEAVGRRKTAIARVRLQSGAGDGMVDAKTLNDYFSGTSFRQEAVSPIANLKLEEKFDVNAKVVGGGIMAQAQALRHGLARALTKMNPAFKKRLRVLGFLTRDPRMVERK